MEIKNLAEQYIYWPEVENPYQKNINLSNVTLENFAPLLLEQSQKERVLVGDSIMRFYALNEILAKTRRQENEVLEVKSLDLYDDYINEVETSSKKIFAYIFSICVMEARHCREFKKIERIDERLNNAMYYSEELNKDHIHKKYEQKKEVYINEKFENYASKGKVTGDDFSIERFKLFYDMINELSQIDSYDRDQIQQDVIPFLYRDDTKALTLEEAFIYLEKIFTIGDFNGGYGGQAWGKIASHALCFVQGKINAEVFIDQAFSLEHNGGQIFNKDLIFECDNITYWKSCNMAETYPEIKSDRILNSQFFLNAQHQGQLLSLLKYGTTEVNTSSAIDSMESYKKIGVIEETITQDNVYKVIGEINSNIYDLNNIIMGFHERNSDFADKIKNFTVDTPSLDLFAILNNATKVEKHQKVKLDERHLGFHKLANQMVMDSYRLVNNSKDGNIKPYEYYFEYLDTKHLPEHTLKKEFLGNKALGLAQMHAMNLPVPAALVFPTTNANAFFKEKAKWLNDLRPQLHKIVDFFKDSQGNPVACSVRSGAPVSMPGMMDTILNVGIDDSNYDYFCQKMGKKVTNECVIKFMSLFTKSLLNEEIDFSHHFPKAIFQFREVLSRHKIGQSYDGHFPLDARRQYKWCLEAVFQSCNSERATAYRIHQGISEDMGTAAIVQQMVFGNLNEQSCTGVVFSRDCISGEKGIIGEFLPKAQGEDVVSGAVTPLNIKELKDFNPVIYQELLGICERLEKETGDIQDIEFTVEDGKLYILQKRKAVCSSLAQTKLNQELFENGLITEEKMFKDIKIDALICRDIVDSSYVKEELKGLVGNPGVMRGIVIHCEEDMQTYAQVYEANKRDSNFGWIFYAPETSPDHAPIMIKTQAFITSNGGFTSHAAILSRSWDKPCIVGIGQLEHDLLTPGSLVTIDANNGKIYRDIIALKEGSKKEVDSVVNRVLAYYNVNREELIKSNPFEQILKKVNERESWMKQYPQSSYIEDKPVRLNKFLDISQKLALLIVKSQNETKVTVEKAQEVVQAIVEKEINNEKYMEDKKVDINELQLSDFLSAPYKNATFLDNLEKEDYMVNNTKIRGMLF